MQKYVSLKYLAVETVEIESNLYFDQQYLNYQVIYGISKLSIDITTLVNGISDKIVSANASYTCVLSSMYIFVSHKFKHIIYDKYFLDAYNDDRKR